MSLVFRTRILKAGTLNSGYFNILPFAVVKSDLDTVRHCVYPRKDEVSGTVMVRECGFKV